MFKNFFHYKIFNVKIKNNLLLQSCLK